MKTALIIPYFGKFPNYFYLHLISIRHNPDFTWFFFTDDYTEYDYPPNAKVFYMSFDEMRSLVQSKFDFPIALERPYKLCDFKPAYGHIFAEYLKEYDYWGHCDLDVIWGDLNKYLKDKLAEDYDLLYREGALRLYKNDDNINQLYKKEGSIFNYKKVFSHKENYSFDEELGIQRIAERNRIKLYVNDNDVADIDAFVGPLYIRRVCKKRWKDEAGIFRSIKNYKNQIFRWENGKVYRIYIDNGLVGKDEFMYLHLLKRKMDIGMVSKNAESFTVIPNKFIAENVKEIPEINEIEQLSNNSKMPSQEKFAHKLCRKLRRYKGMSKNSRRITMKQRLYSEIFNCFGAFWNANIKGKVESSSRNIRKIQGGGYCNTVDDTK